MVPLFGIFHKETNKLLGASIERDVIDTLNKDNHIVKQVKIVSLIPYETPIIHETSNKGKRKAYKTSVEYKPFLNALPENEVLLDLNNLNEKAINQIIHFILKKMINEKICMRKNHTFSFLMGYSLINNQFYSVAVKIVFDWYQSVIYNIDGKYDLYYDYENYNDVHITGITDDIDFNDIQNFNAIFVSKNDRDDELLIVFNDMNFNQELIEEIYKCFESQIYLSKSPFVFNTYYPNGVY